MSHLKTHDRQKAIIKASVTQPPVVPTQTLSGFSEDVIRTRAYEIYERRGKMGDCAEDDWLRAKSELMTPHVTE